MNKDIKINTTFNTKNFTISIQCLDVIVMDFEMTVIIIKNINTQCKICEIIVYENSSSIAQANAIFKVYDIDVILYKKCKHEELYLYKGDYRCKKCSEII